MHPCPSSSFPLQTNSFNVESLRGHAITKGLKDTIDSIEKDVGKVGLEGVGGLVVLVKPTTTYWFWFSVFVFSSSIFSSEAVREMPARICARGCGRVHKVGVILNNLIS